MDVIVIKQFPDPNPVQVSKSQLAWAQELHQANEQARAEREGIALGTNKTTKRRWWHRNKTDPETLPQQP